MFTLTEPTGVVQTLAFHPSGLALSAAGADKTIRTWELTPTQNRPADGGEAETTASVSAKQTANAQGANAQAAKTAPRRRAPRSRATRMMANRNRVRRR